MSVGRKAPVPLVRRHYTRDRTSCAHALKLLFEGKAVEQRAVSAVIAYPKKGGRR